jgi:ribonuclease Z
VIAVTLLGTGGPVPDPHRAGPSTLVQAGGENYLVDCGRGVLMRLAAAGVAPGALTAVLVTHLHSDHITDLNDVITTQWITTFEPTPLRIVGPVGLAAAVDHILASLGPDIAYRIAHHADLERPPLVEVNEVEVGPVELGGSVAVTVAPTDHRPVEPSIAFRFDHAADDHSDDGGAVGVVVAGDTVPCAGLDELCAGADALVHTVLRRDIVSAIPIQRMQETLDYHSSVEEAAQTAHRAGVDVFVMTHYIPTFQPGSDDEWRARAAAHFTGRIELGADLHRVEVGARTSTSITT